ncbi:hypothetical protein [Halostagnicola sp. A-GB9-2]|uniref:hypothetical protein n=1 Tax=Halostagnicola sp. A-GB9-2 TaxID=3048066 RepID=UPI0024BF7F25|nr:hypothetical protein [Halostagnicola sp. A-GB9-2]MDJ1432111.1 hypothetical protein [Halostagnicola sp. A-GB9-2]
MVLSVSARTRRVFLVGCLAYFGLQSVANLLNHGSSVWLWAGGYAIASFSLFGPLAWFVRDRIPAERREALKYPVSGAIFLCFVLVFGVELALGGVLFFFDAVIVGGLVGLVIVLLAEKTVVPARFRANESGGL